MEDMCFHRVKSPFMSLPNPRGTVRFFLHAVESGKKEEALGYLAHSVAEMVDFEEMKTMLGVCQGYHFFSDEEKSGVRRVTLAGSEEETILIDMLAEPNDFGKWKIFRIEKG